MCQVFAEKMGIEAGWNCHVSLMPSDSVTSVNSSVCNLASVNTGETPEGGPTDIGSSPASIGRDVLGVLMPRTHSAPSFMNTDEVQVSEKIWTHKCLA